MATLGHTVLMGRKTFESLGKPLPRRRNIVLTRAVNWQHPGVEVLHDITDVSSLEGEVRVIGGAEIYRALEERMDEWLVSHIKEEHQGDTYLTEFEADFPQVEIVEDHERFTVKRHRRT